MVRNKGRRPDSNFKRAAIMTMKSAALLALVGMLLLAIFSVAGLIEDVVGIVRGLIPPVRLLTSLVYVFANLTVVVFLWVFHKAQS
jgi:hypothetical protein